MGNNKKGEGEGKGKKSALLTIVTKGGKTFNEVRLEEIMPAIIHEICNQLFSSDPKKQPSFFYIFLIMLQQYFPLPKKEENTIQKKEENTIQKKEENTIQKEEKKISNVINDNVNTVSLYLIRLYFLFNSIRFGENAVLRLALENLVNSQLGINFKINNEVCKDIMDSIINTASASASATDAIVLTEFKTRGQTSPFERAVDTIAQWMNTCSNFNYKIQQRAPQQQIQNDLQDYYSIKSIQQRMFSSKNIEKIKNKALFFLDCFQYKYYEKYLQSFYQFVMLFPTITDNTDTDINTGEEFIMLILFLGWIMGCFLHGLKLAGPYDCEPRCPITSNFIFPQQTSFFDYFHAFRDAVQDGKPRIQINDPVKKKEFEKFSLLLYQQVRVDAVCDIKGMELKQKMNA